MENSDKIKNLQDQLIKELSKTESINYDLIATLSKKFIGFDEQSIRFSVDASHIHRLGFELVGKQETALGELIKNAFDADAAEVQVTFEKYDQPGGMLIISDNGSGMTLELIKEAWMRLSTKSKVDGPFSPLFGRSRAGRKGIGRFAVERLGENLRLETTVNGALEGIRVEFDWDSMSLESSELDLIAFKIEKFQKNINLHGTTLTISNLRDKWSEKQFERVWKSVLFLQSPTGGVKRENIAHNPSYVLDPGFSVVINGTSDSFIAKEYSLQTTFLDERLAKFKGIIDSNGIATYTLHSEKLGGLTDSHSLGQPFLGLSPMEFNVDYFIYGDKLINGFSKVTAQDLGKRFGGIRVYRDGFRVLPYGEQGNDWLALDYDYGRRDVLNPYGNQNFFGFVEFGSSANPLLEETSGREGLIENDTFEELRSFLREGLQWAVLRIAAARGKKIRKSKDHISLRKPSEIIEEAISEASNLSSTAASIGVSSELTVSIPLVELENIKNKTREYENAAEKSESEHIEYESMLRILASLGTSISVFSHEIGGAVNGILGGVRDAEDVIQDANIQDKFTPIITNIKNSATRLEDLSGYVLALIHRSSAREKSEIALYQSISNFVKYFTHYLSSRSISISYSVHPKHLRTKVMHKTEIDSVLFNFLTNSIKAIDRGGDLERKIRIEAFARNDFAVLAFEDSGAGVTESIQDRIFDAFFTTTSVRDEDVPGPGAGLGLKIVDDIASANGGLVKLANPSPSYKCRFEFSVPLAPSQGSLL